jgi:predicted acetyltransferase
MEMRETREESAWRVELMEGESSISRCWVVDRRLRVGRAALVTGGIGGVGTLEAHRHRGYSRQVLEYAVKLMERERLELSFLHGIRDYYHRFGFITCMAEHDFSLEVRDAERALAGARTRPIRTGDRRRLIDLYNRDNLERTGSAVRDPKTWSGFHRGSQYSVPGAVQVVVDGRDRPLGYVVYDRVEDRCRAPEVGGQGEAVFAAILGFLARRAVRLRRERIHFNLPVDHPFAVYCLDYGLQVSTLHPRNGGGMGRIVDLMACLRALLPELERRWGDQDRGLTLGLRTDLGTATLAWQQGRLTLATGAGRQTARLGHAHLTQLLMGYVGVSDLVGLNRLQGPRPLLALMARLFPRQQAQLWWADRF